MCQQILLSHSSRDKVYGDILVSLLLEAGLNRQQILYSSDPNCGIPIGCDIFQYLRAAIEKGAFMIYLLSEHYYSSTACMNEMGAAWLHQNQSFSVAVPHFDYSDKRFQSSAANPRSLVIPMEDKVRMRQFIEQIVAHFQVEKNTITIEVALQHYFEKLDNLQNTPPTDEEKDKSTNPPATAPQEDSSPELFYVTQGRRLWAKEKDYPAAIQQFLYAIYINENCASAYNKIVEIATEKKDYSRAWRFSDEAVRRFPNRADVYGCRGYLECSEKQFHEAIEDCTKAISLGTNRWYYNTRGLAYWSLRQYYDALVDFWTAHQIDSHYEPSLRHLKNLCRRVGIDQLFQTALKEKQENHLDLCHIYLSCILLTDPEHEKAKSELDALQ